MTSETAAASRSLIGRYIDERYRLEAEIGVGGLGSVYRATHTKLERTVAVKLLHENYGANALQRARFEREAKALATLEHPNIVTISDYGVSDDRPYLVMELLEGETLAQRVKRGPLPLENALSIVKQLLSALSFMHAAGLVHRDVKPSNVFLQRLSGGGERVKVLDFGLAKYTVPPQAGSDPTLTRDGTIVGTPAYMSPEQATGEMVDTRSDVYAVGVLLFQMLRGHLPFEGDAIEQVRSHLIAPVPQLGAISGVPEFDAKLQSLIECAMAKRREDRFSNAAEMLAALLADVPADFPSASPGEPAQAAVHELASDEVLAIANSSEMSTAARRAVARVGWLWRARVATRRAFMLSVRLVSVLSVVLVVACVLIFSILFRSEPDRADLITLQRRVSDRWIARNATQQPNDSSGAFTSAASGTARSREPAEPVPVVRAEAAVTLDAAVVLPASALPASAPTPAPDAGPHALPPAAAEASASTPTLAVDAGQARGHDALPPPAASPEASKSLQLPAAATVTTVAPASAQPVAVAQPTLAPANAPPAPAPPPASNPWALALPKPLRTYYKLVVSGARGSERTALQLRAYNQEHPDDPRGHLLLGQLYLNRLWRPDALSQFALALQLDLSMRGAPEVLPALLELIIQGKVAGEAERLLVRAFGSEAVPAIERALTTVKDPDALRRLRALRTRIGSVR